MSRQPTLEDFGLILEHILTEPRSSLFAGTNTGRIYQPMLAQALAMLRELPEPKGELPLKEDVEDSDLEHDCYGRAFWLITEAMQELEPWNADAARMAQTLRSNFLEALAELRLPYSEEAAAAKKRLEKLPEHEAVLRGLLVPGGSLYDWVRTYLRAGVRLGELLAARGEQSSSRPPEGRKEAGALRSKIWRLIKEARLMLLRELVSNPGLPETLSAQIFGYYDEILRSRATQAAPLAPPPEAPAP